MKRNAFHNLTWYQKNKTEAFLILLREAAVAAFLILLREAAAAAATGPSSSTYLRCRRHRTFVLYIPPPPNTSSFLFAPPPSHHRARKPPPNPRIVLVLRLCSQFRSPFYWVSHLCSDDSTPQRRDFSPLRVRVVHCCCILLVNCYCETRTSHV